MIQWCWHVGPSSTAVASSTLGLSITCVFPITNLQFSPLLVYSFSKMSVYLYTLRGSHLDYTPVGYPVKINAVITVEIHSPDRDRYVYLLTAPGTKSFSAGHYAI